MTDKQKFLDFERKLRQLKEEESKILKILKDVRKQLKKYEVEELQTCNDSLVKNVEDSDSEESAEENTEMLLRIMDSAGIVNTASLNLNTDKIFGDRNKESEDSDESD